MIRPPARAAWRFVSTCQAERARISLHTPTTVSQREHRRNSSLFYAPWLLAAPKRQRPALDNFLATHPQAKLFALAPKPIPASFASESFYAVDAFRFTNREGASRYGRYRIIPDGGTKHLDAVEAARRPANFLFDELADRLSRGPIKFYIAVQLAEEGDVIEDPSLPWPDERPEVEFGVLNVTERRMDSASIERTLDFDPSRLVDGIDLSGDPILLVRSAIYAIARRRRLASTAAPGVG